MKNLILLNRSGMGPDVMSRKGRYSLDPILSRLCLVSLICLCMLTIGIGNAWGATHTWNLATNSFSASSKTSVTWSSTYATMVLTKENSSTNANNYLGGSNAHTRMYTSQKLTITAASGYTISSVAITATGNSYITGLSSPTWTNASKSTSGKVLTLTPTTGTSAFYCTVSGTVRLTQVVVTYSASGGGSTYSITYALNGGSGTTPTESAKSAGAEFTLHNGTTGITPPTGKIFSKWRDQDSNDFSGGATYTMPAKNVTLTAQWIDEPSCDYDAATSLSVGDEIIIVIPASSKQMKSEASGGEVVDYPNVCPDEELIFTVEEGYNGSDLALKTSDDKYLSWSSGTTVQLVNSVTSTNQNWTTETVGGVLLLKNKGDNRYLLYYNNTNMRLYQSASQASTVKPTIYVLNGCEPLGSVSGSITSNTPASVTLSWSAVTGAEKYQVKVPGSSSHNAWTDVNTTSVTVTKSCGTAYTAYFRAIDTNGTHCSTGPESTTAVPAVSYTVTSTGVTNATASPAIPSTTCASGFSTTISAATGYALPAEITVTNASKTWNSSTGALTISSVTGNVSITITPTCVPPVVTGDPADADYYIGDSPTALSVSATLASGTLTYLWKVSTNGGSTWSNATGTNNLATYNGASLSTASAGTIKFKCIVGNSQGGCSVESGVATITVSSASYFPNNKTIFIQAHSTSAWTGGGCVKAWFHTAGGSEAAQTTYWLFDAGSPDEGKKLFAAIVPSTGNLPYLDIQRFAANCNDGWNKNGGCSYADADGSNAVRSTGKNDDASDGDFIRWNDDAVTLSLYGDPNTWGSSLASFSDQGNGVWTATYSNYAPANAAGESQDFKICTNYNGWIGNTGSNNNVTVSDMHVGSTYNIGASLDIKDHSLTLTKTFVKGTVHFDLQGHGSAISDLTNVTAGSKISAPSAPTASGWHFIGWYKEPACTNAWNFGSDVVNETMTLYAKWVQTFTVTYNSNGGSGSMTDSNSPYDSGATVTVKSNSFTAPTGKEFNHWDTKDDDTGTDYAPAATFTISANTTLYAQWSFVNYNVTYSAPSNGNYTIKVADGTASSATKTANYNQTITIAATPSANYRFGSWTIRNTSTSADVTSTLLTGDKPTTASTTFTMPAYGVTITATFVQTHTVSWKSNGADYISPVTYDHGGTLVLPSPNPSAPAGCSSKVFMGWTSDPEITVATSDAPSYISAGGAVNADATYRAVFADKDDSGGSATTTITDASSWSKKGTSGGGTPGTTGLGTIVIGDVVTLNIQKCYVSTGDIRIYKDYDITFETATSAQKITYIRFNTMADAGSSYQAKNLQAWIDDGTGNNTEDPHGSDVYNSSTTKWDYVWDNSTGATSVLLTATERTDLGSITVSYTSVSYDNYITLCSSCTTPSDLEVSSITSTGGTVSWDGVSAVQSTGSGTGFTVLWGTDPVRANNSNTANVAAGTNEYAITGLTSATRYYVWVQSKCNDEWSSSTNFYTNAKITYAAGTGASGLMDPKEVTYNTNVTVDACTFTAPSGKVFDGWVSDQAVTVSAVSTTSVPDGATITGLTKAITLTAQWRDLAVYHVTFSADNGTVAGGSSQNVLEGGTLTFPNVTSTTCGTFQGWVEAAYDNTAAPSGATYHAVGDELAADPSMDGKTYYAVYRVATGAPTNINDELTAAKIGVTSYEDWSGIADASAAVYAGNSTKNTTYSNSIQIRTTNSNSGIVTTTSGGLAKKVTFDWVSGNTAGRVVDIYGKNSAYSSATDLYSNDAATQGTKIGSIIYGTSTEVTISTDYEYIGIRSNNGAAYIGTITIQWYGAPMRYQTSPACSPVVSLTSSFSSFTYVYGSGPSASQSFTVSGTNLSTNPLVVTAPANYEVCKTSGGTYTSSVSYTPSDGTVTDQTVYIRLAGGLNVGTYNYAAASGVSAASTGATTRTAALNGSVTKATGSIAFTNFNAVDHYEAELTGSSVDVTLTVSVTGDGSVSYTRSPAAGSSAVPATTPTTTLHTTTTGTWTVTATLTAGTNYTGSSTSCQVIVYKADRFYDNVHGNDMILKRNDTGEDHYTIPSLSDESRLLSGSCSETHYHFMGWVPESALSSLPNDAAYDAVMITGGGTQSATGTNYYAVWAEE